MSAAIATASRDDRPSSTIGTDSSIASGDFPTALPTQLRSHCRISGTVMSVLLGGRVRAAVGRWRSSDFGVVDVSHGLFGSVRFGGEGRSGDPTPLRRLPSR